MSESKTDRRKGLAARLSSILQHLKQAVLERSKRGKPRRMVLLEALQLGNRRQLFLVACDEHRFLVGAGSDRIGTLVAIPETSSEAVPGAASGDIKSQAAMQQAHAARGSERGRDPAWMRPSGFERTAGRGLQLVQRENATANGATVRKGLEAGRTQ
ncbi:flagellar biogenesis protein FliO [Granulicella aggregans]|uniref:Flagellar biogenesis protein FliO n=1 Tax=Granulicella aggregans TaxID=474949 RepID=A0A7W7ZD94_9BACT|nr:flagellar biosynthetic protein FliO [Granulicella aggregans]MBB5057628.1 flagellar biogenesis protein FliO [Granulicella aggregans]